MKTDALRLDAFRVQHLLRELDTIAAHQREVLMELHELLGGRRSPVDKEPREETRTG